NLKNQERKSAQANESLVDTKNRIQKKLESYQELYDANQKYITLGKRFDKIAETFFYNKRKRQLNDELFKLVLLENSKRQRMARRQQRKQEAAKRKVEQEVKKKLEEDRKKKEKKKKRKKKHPNQK